MLDVLGHTDPCMLPRFIDREDWRWKAWISEGAYRDSNDPRHAVKLVIDGRAACGAEAERRLATCISGEHPFGRMALDTHLLAFPARLRREDAARTPLTVKAVTYRDPARVSLANYAELAAATRGLP